MCSSRGLDPELACRCQGTFADAAMHLSLSVAPGGELELTARIKKRGSLTEAQPVASSLMAAEERIFFLRSTFDDRLPYLQLLPGATTDEDLLWTGERVLPRRQPMSQDSPSLAGAA
jgi:hypothetical protein